MVNSLSPLTKYFKSYGLPAIDHGQKATPS